jgi:hypothetical protein
MKMLSVSACIFAIVLLSSHSLPLFAVWNLELPIIIIHCVIGSNSSNVCEWELALAVLLLLRLLFPTALRQPMDGCWSSAG